MGADDWIGTMKFDLATPQPCAIEKGATMRVQHPDGTWHLYDVEDVQPDPDGFGIAVSVRAIDGETHETAPQPEG